MQCRIPALVSTSAITKKRARRAEDDGMVLRAARQTRAPRGQTQSDGSDETKSVSRGGRGEFSRAPGPGRGRAALGRHMCGKQGNDNELFRLYFDYYTVEFNLL